MSEFLVMLLWTLIELPACLGGALGQWLVELWSGPPGFYHPDVQRRTAEQLGLKRPR